MTTAVEVEDLRKVSRSKAGEPVRALDGVSFQVPQGRIYGRLGPNRAGKSTNLVDPRKARAATLPVLAARIARLFVLAYVGAAATKSIILGLIILATANFFVPVQIMHPASMIAPLLVGV